MPDDDAFLRAVLADPDDDEPRLVYADWLEERGDVRGEFIALQCRLARLRAADPARPAMAARARQLRRAHGRDWAGPLGEFAGRCRFRRGFVEEVEIDARAFLADAPALFRAAPVRRLKLLSAATLMRRVAVCPELAHLTHLNLSENFVRAGGVDALAASPYLSGLRVLNLARNGLGSGGVRALAASALPARLVRLNLADNVTYNAGAVTLAECPTLGGLSVLRLSWNCIGRAGAEALAASPHLTAVITLDLRGNLPGTQGALALRERFAHKVRL
jgi:uncharacterized protein (TIGR02996 family)